MKTRYLLFATLVCALSFQAANAQQSDKGALVQSVPTRSADPARTQTDVLQLLRDAQYDAAVAAADAFVSVARERNGVRSVAYADALSLRGYVHMVQGAPADARSLFQTALQIYEGGKGQQRSIATARNNIGQTYFHDGQYDDAEAQYKQALALQEALQPPDPSATLASLFNLGQVQQRRERFSDAEQLLRRALAMSEALYPPTDVQLAIALQNLGTALASQRKMSEAEAFFRRAVDIRRGGQSADHPELAGALQALGVSLYRQKRHTEAEAALTEAIQIRRKSPAFQAVLGGNLTDLAQIHILQRRHAEAEALIVEALGLFARHLPATHPSVAEANFSLSIVLEDQGRLKQALDAARTASAVQILRNANDSSARYQYQTHLRLLWANWAAMPLRDRHVLLDEAFSVAQRSTNTAAAVSVSRMTARLAASDPALQQLVREQQDLESKDGALERLLLEARANAESARVDALRLQSEKNSQRRDQISKALAAQFPNYSKLARPQPLDAAAIRQSLSIDDALLYFVETYDGVFVWCLTRDSAAWKRLSVDASELGRSASEMHSMIVADKGFDFSKAHGLYAKLFGPVEPLLKGKTHLYIVPSGPLTSLPFSALVTTPPRLRVADGKNTESFKRADWFIRRFAFSILPSVANLQALKSVAVGPTDRKPLIGFANPALEADQQLAATIAPSAAVVRGGAGRSSAAVTSRTSASIKSYWRGGSVDFTEVRKLGSIPQAEVELKTISATLPGSTIYLRGEATETVVKRANLEQYRIIYFATHALVTGEMGAGEPSLVLSLPTESTAQDDGLLTASEVSLLKLNADWVVLSACNTGAPSKEGAEALSGLAQAFFYAGARALLVSHWNVDDIVSAKLMTRSFEAIAKNPGAGRARALQKAMLSVIADPSEKLNTRPSYWAPFFVVGAD